MNYVVTTTINVPTLLEEYIKDFEEHNHQYHIVVAGDLKTPAAARQFCHTLPHTTYLGPEEQKQLFSHLPLYRFVPFNSIDRRNFAYLFCFQQGMNPNDTLVTIDDDNFLQQPDFLGHHQRRTITGPTSTADQPTWYNALEPFYEEDIFPRGFSMYEHTPNQERAINQTEQTSPIALNQGLWSGNPDVDAITRLAGLTGDYPVVRSESVTLGHNTLCPADTQNTAYLNGFALSAHLCPFVGRFDDIISSYITKRLADHFGHVTTYGAPVARQDRNQHSTYHDFLLELHGMSQIDTFVDFLWTRSLTATSILEAYVEIGQILAANFTPPPLHHGRQHHTTQLWSIAQVAPGIALWADTLDQLNVQDVTPAAIALPTANVA